MGGNTGGTGEQDVQVIGRARTGILHHTRKEFFSASPSLIDDSVGVWVDAGRAPGQINSLIYCGLSYTLHCCFVSLFPLLCTVENGSLIPRLTYELVAYRHWVWAGEKYLHLMMLYHWSTSYAPGTDYIYICSSGAAGSVFVGSSCVLLRMTGIAGRPKRARSFIKRLIGSTVTRK